MRRHRTVLVVAAVTALGVTGAPAAGAAANDVPGSKVLQGLSGSWSQAADINNHDVVVGVSSGTAVRWDFLGRITALPVPSGVSWASAGEITDSGFILGGSSHDNGAGGTLQFALSWDPHGNLIDTQSPPGTQETYAADVNESGTVVGAAVDADAVRHAVRWDSEGRVTELRMLPGGTSSGATAINDQGAAVGYSDVVIGGTHVTHAVYWDAAGRMMDLGGPFSNTASEAVDINNAGMILGSRGDQVVRWSRLGRVTVLAPPPNYSSYRPVAMNDDGVVLGQAQGYLSDFMAEHPIRWDVQGRVTDLGGADSFTYHTWASAMNSTGTVVGTSDDGWHMPGVPRYSGAMTWDPAGNIVSLGGPVGSWNTATGVNDRGVVCGASGNNDGSNMHAVLWNRWQVAHSAR
ncbi:hypothetical protein [Actinophytocola sp.]|uniref:hypothetical protein n=1 Tax=Actinophytocola sp. TaxID=1872138 RepID=UPI003899E673